MFTSIRAANPTDPRPQLLDASVLTAAIQTTLPLYAAWAKRKGANVTDEALAFGVEVAIKQARAGTTDVAWAATSLLEGAFGLPADVRLATLIETTNDRLKVEWEALTRAWVMRTGYRIPADMDHKVEAIVNGVPTVGKIVALSRSLGVAYLQTEDHTQTYRIDGEDIVANYTDGRFSPETPILGSRYDDAPALAAAAEAARPKTRKLPAKPVDDALARQQRIAETYRTGAVNLEDGPGVA